MGIYVDCCLFTSTLLPLSVSFLTLLAILVRQRPPCTRLGRIFYVSLGINALALAFVLFCFWFQPWDGRRSELISELLERLWNEHPFRFATLLFFGYFALGMFARAALGRTLPDEERQDED